VLLLKKKLKGAKFNKFEAGRNRGLYSKFITNKRLLFGLLFAIYLAFILISRIPIIAEDNYTDKMKESYTYHLTYKINGYQGHYYVERYDNQSYGYIDLTYTTPSNTLEVNCRNVKVLWIFSRSMYEDECYKVYGIDPSTDSNYYKKYFIDRDLFHVHVYTQQMIMNLTFIDVPLPYNVTVNSEEWWISGINYTYNGKDIVFTHVPSGHTYVDIYFQNVSPLAPTAKITVSSTLTLINENLLFDAADSTDPDGEIVAYVWDFGDGNFSSNVIATQKYSKPGNYTVILMVRDNDHLIDRASIIIKVINKPVAGSNPKILRRIPDQIMDEDSPPWNLYLSPYESDDKDSGTDLNWYVTGQNNSLYTLLGEFSDNDVLQFIPIQNAFGYNKITLWLVDSDGLMDSQSIWVNLTPVNDKPIIYGAPDLIVHYDDPYTFDYSPYIYDIETPKDGLSITALETTDSSYTSVNGHNITYTYPRNMLDEEQFVTIIVSDGEATVNDIIKVTVTDDWVPKLNKCLPDVTIYEGTKVKNVFDLDDYFYDPDDDSLFYTNGETHVTIEIIENQSVDISSFSEWSGRDTVTFRAEDPEGAIAEDTIFVTVLPVNDPPSISGVPDLYVHYDYDYKFDLSTYISDKDNESYQLKVFTSDPVNIRFDKNYHMTMIVNYPEDMNEMTVPVKIVVSDGLESSMQIINITITDDYPPEIHTPLPDIEFYEDTQLLNIFDLDKFFFDLDGDSLFYSYGHSNILVEINENHSVNFASKLNWYGTETVTFRAEDPIGALAEDRITVNVLPVNDAPEILEVPDQEGQVGKMWVVELSQYINDVDNNLADLDISVDSDLVVVSGTNLIFYSDHETTKEITIEVSDGDKTSTSTFSATFNKNDSDPSNSDVILLIILIIILIVVVSAMFVYKKYKGKYDIEDVFLIYYDGTLISHKTNRNWEEMDEDLVGAMFTAVQDFVKTSFAKTDGHSLVSSLATLYPISPSPYKVVRKPELKEWQVKHLKLEKHDILIERGRYVYLTVIYSGNLGWNLQYKIKKVMQEIEANYIKELRRWSGNMNKLIGLDKIIEPIIHINK
jgi:hypothetical protein